MIVGRVRVSKGKFEIRADVDGVLRQVGRNHRTAESAIAEAQAFIRERRWNGYVIVRNRNNDWHYRVTV